MKACGSLPLIACAMGFLTACGIADPHSSVPRFMRQSEPAPPPPEAPPDVKELIRAGGVALFTSPPKVAAVSPPKRNAKGDGWIACVKAAVTSAMSSTPAPVTLVVSFDHGRLGDRRRALPEDGCEAESYEKIVLPPPEPRVGPPKKQP